MITFHQIWKTARGSGNGYTTGCLIDYFYFKEYKMAAIDLSKQQELNADPKAIQQINFTGNLDQQGNVRMIFIIEEGKETIFDFLQETVSIINLFCFNIININIKWLNITL